MIPRCSPSYSLDELQGAFRHSPDVVELFEKELAAYFNMKYAITFPYGRSAIYACLQALELSGNEVIQPAYNCVVVAHATVKAGFRPVFVDTLPNDPNQDMEKMIEKVGFNTAAVIPTSIFGMSFDAVQLCKEIRRKNPNTFILTDCCQSFNAQWKGNLLVREGDAAILAFGIGKPMTSLFGGALLTNRADIILTVKRYRDRVYTKPDIFRSFKRLTYFLASWIAFSGPCVNLTNFLESSSNPLQWYLKRFRTREAIKLPRDNQFLLTKLEASIGCIQLRKVKQFMDRRSEIASRYNLALAHIPYLKLLDWTKGSTYAIYSARFTRPEKRGEILSKLIKKGIQCGTVLNYVVPALSCYQEIGYSGLEFPHAMAWADSVINFPDHPTMTDKHIQYCINTISKTFYEEYGD
ncbi:MAG: DegT/DnrJ/EryC1/StrS family aminotransferase [Nitrospirota bacterium]